MPWRLGSIRPWIQSVLWVGPWKSAILQHSLRNKVVVAVEWTQRPRIAFQIFAPGTLTQISFLESNLPDLYLQRTSMPGKKIMWEEQHFHRDIWTTKRPKYTHSNKAPTKDTLQVGCQKLKVVFRIFWIHPVASIRLNLFVVFASLFLFSRRWFSSHKKKQNIPVPVRC